MTSRPQPTISAFFKSSPQKTNKRRASSHIDLTLDDTDEAPEIPIKRPRLGGHANYTNSPPQVGSPSTGNKRATTTTTVAAGWRYAPEEVNHASPSKPRTKAEKERHQAFKRKLLQDNNLFLKMDLNVDELDHSEAMNVDINSQETNHDASDEDDDGRFEKLNKLFAHQDKGKVKAKGKSTALPKRTKVVELGPSGEPYTPLEKQILQLKKNNVGTVLMVEVGYKYKFYGDDAKVAGKELGMVAYQDRNFLVASIPTHRRDIHMKKLLSRGYRVGIADQIETAALKKVSDNRNAPFERQVTHLYTAATYVDELDSVDDMERYTAPPFMCLIEERTSTNSADVSIGIITICPSTGDIVWDDFSDTVMRIELETRLVHTRPSELLLPKDQLSEETAKMLSHFTGISTAGHRIRTEQFSNLMDYTAAFDRVTDFYTDKRKFSAASENFRTGMLMAAVADFPKRVVIALAHAIKYLSGFGIADAFLETKFFTKFATRAHMLLAANTLINLEIYQNETDHGTRGSLIWVLDRTKTKFGARLLRSWIGRPLVDKRILQDRVDAVEEILESSSERLLKLREILKGLPDLAKGLSRIQYGQCTPKELAVLLRAFGKIAKAFNFDTPDAVGLKSNVLTGIISSLPKLKEPMEDLMQVVNLEKASEGKKDTMWKDPEKYPEIIDSDMALQAIEMELMDELKAIQKLLRMPSLQWATVATDEASYLVEVKRIDNRPIPENWILHSKTKYLARYQPPSVRAKLEEKAQYRERLDAEANKAFRSFLSEISQNYYAILRDVVNKIATADCLFSLAQVALQDNYVRPEFTDDDILEIVDGRHPMIESYSDQPYVPNSINMGDGEAKCKIVTGPNMGGKSSCVRMIALIALMAQIGSYVPAVSLKMGLLDSILTRMGASDDLARGRSTFMVEMSETSEILQTATAKSLVILDELGRGTATFDGMAIADATLQYLVQTVKCKTLFITHYPLVATKLSKKFLGDVENLHMSYEADESITGIRRVTFLYNLVPGLATESFGIECGRLAKVPEGVLSVAADKASHMEEEVRGRIRRNKLLKSAQQIQGCLESTGIQAEAALEDLRATMESLQAS